MKKHDIIKFKLPMINAIEVEGYILSASDRSSNITVILLDNVGAYEKGTRVNIDRSTATFVRKS